MGQGVSVKCSKCEYGSEYIQGVGMMYSPDAVFFGRCDDPTQNWSVAFPDGYCEDDKPILDSLVKSKRIKEAAFELLSKGGKPGDYGHELYCCPKCHRLLNRFYFEVITPTEKYEPAYRCSRCKTALVVIDPEEKEGGCKLYDRKGNEVEWQRPECKDGQLELGGICCYGY